MMQSQGSEIGCKQRMSRLSQREVLHGHRFTRAHPRPISLASEELSISLDQLLLLQLPQFPLSSLSPRRLRLLSHRPLNLFPEVSRQNRQSLNYSRPKLERLFDSPNRPEMRLLQSRRVSTDSSLRQRRMKSLMDQSITDLRHEAEKEAKLRMLRVSGLLERSKL